MRVQIIVQIKGCDRYGLMAGCSSICIEWLSCPNLEHWMPQVQADLMNGWYQALTCLLPRTDVIIWSIEFIYVFVFANNNNVRIVSFVALISSAS